MRSLAARRWLGVSLAFALGGCAGAPRTTFGPGPHEEAMAAIRARETARDLDSAAFRADLEHHSPHVRRVAVRALGRIQDPRAVPLLGTVLASEESNRVLAEVAFALGQIGDPAALPALEGLARHASTTVRARVAEALGKLRDADASGALAELLEDPEPAVRGHVALALWRRGAVEAIPALARHLDPAEHGDVRWRAAYALARLEDPATLAVLRPLTADPDPWVRTYAARGLRTPLDGEALPALAALLEDPASFWTARVEALRTLAALRREPLAAPADGGAIPAVLRAHLERETHPLVLEATIEALAVAADDVDRNLLRRLAAAASLTVRRAALDGLARAAGPEALETIAGSLAAGPLLLRAAAARALGHCGAGAVDTLRTLLADPDTRVRNAVAEACREIGTTEAWVLLDRLARDGDFAVRGSAVTAYLGERPEGWVERAVEIFRDSGAPEFWETRKEILIALREAAPEAARAVAETVLDDPLVIVRREARTTLGLAQGPEVTELTPPAPPIGRHQIVDGGHPHLVLETDRGELVLELYLDDAPIHVANVIHLARSGFYDGLLFHRVVPNWVIQGGDPHRDGWGDAGYLIPDEINPRPYLRGTLGMPKAGKDTGGCQIFITQLPAPSLDGRFTVFGRVILGMEVVDAIEVGDRILAARVDEHRFRGAGEAP